MPAAGAVPAAMTIDPQEIAWRLARQQAESQAKQHKEAMAKVQSALDRGMKLTDKVYKP